MLRGAMRSPEFVSARNGNHRTCSFWKTDPAFTMLVDTVGMDRPRKQSKEVQTDRESPYSERLNWGTVPKRTKQNKFKKKIVIKSEIKRGNNRRRFCYPHRNFPCGLAWSSTVVYRYKIDTKYIYIHTHVYIIYIYVCIIRPHLHRFERTGLFRG